MFDCANFLFFCKYFFNTPVSLVNEDAKDLIKY